MFTALDRDGLASDAALADLTDVVAYRLHIALGSADRCCDPTALTLVALTPADPSLPDQVRDSVRDLAPGSAVAAAAHGELVGGWVAMPGITVRVTGTAELGHDGVVAVTLDDAAAFLQADSGDRLIVRTTVVTTAAPPAEPLAGWRVVAAATPDVPLLPAGSAHQHDGACAA